MRVPSLALGAALTAVLLAGCTSSSPTPSDGASGASGSGGSGSSAGAAPAASATPTAGAGALSATPLSHSCTALVPAATVASAYPGMTLQPSPGAPAKSDAAVIGAYQGTVCTWKASGGSTMTLAVGQFDDDSLTRLKNSLATSSTPVPTYQGEGYFDLVGTTGTAEAFSGPFWIVATSDDPLFGEPGGAEPLVDAAIAALG